MSPKTDPAVISMVTVLLLAAVAPGLAGAAGETSTELAIEVAQDGGDVTVTVTGNGTAVENATVTVTALNNSSYAGDGEYATDANGTVSLPAPEENVTVDVTATKGDASGSTTADLVAVEEEPEFENFGDRVSWFVHSLLGGDMEGGIGDIVSEFVKNHNPSNDNKPDHAGKDKQDKSNGGPPDHAGNDEDDEDDENDEDEEN